MQIHRVGAVWPNSANAVKSLPIAGLRSCYVVSRFVALIAVSGCQFWRIGPPITRSEPRLDTLLVSTRGDDMELLLGMIRSCHADLRSVTIDAIRQTARHSRWAVYLGVAATGFVTAARVGAGLGVYSSPNDARKTQLSVLGVAAAAWGVTWLDFTFNRSLRETRVRADHALKTWAELRSEMRRWEATVRDSNRSLDLSSVSNPLGPVRTDLSLNPVERQTEVLRTKAASCGGFATRLSQN